MEQEQFSGSLMEWVECGKVEYGKERASHYCCCCCWLSHNNFVVVLLLLLLHAKFIALWALEGALRNQRHVDGTQRTFFLIFFFFEFGC